MKNCIKEKNFPSLLLVALVGIFFLDAVIFNSFGYVSGKFFAVLLVCLAIFLNLENTYYLTVFCFGFASILKVSASSISILSFLYFIVIIKLILQKKQGINAFSLLFFLLFAMMQLLSIIIYNAPLASLISLLVNILFVVYSASFFSTDIDCDSGMLKKAGFFLAISVALNIFLCDLFPNIPYFINAARQEDLVRADRFAALYLDPNEFSQIVLVAVGFLIATFSSYKSTVGKVGIIALSAFLCINGIRSNSKSYVLTLFGLFCLLVLIYMFRIIKARKTIFSLVGTLSLGVISIGVGLFLIFNVIIPIFEFRRGEQTDFFTGRGHIWAMYSDALFQRLDVLFIGCGAGNVTAVLRLVGVYDSEAPHNTYLEFLIQVGILGLSLLLLSWGQVLKSIRRKNTYFWIPLLAFLLTALAISVNANDCLFIVLLILSMPHATEGNA